jgi:hypothetical protein
VEKFPDMETWGHAVIIEGEQKKYMSPSFYNYYKEKFDFCTDAKLPDAPNIVEIGVRYGYSAFSFLSAYPDANYLGIDMINGGHGGIREKDTFPRVREVLKKNFPDANITLTHKNTFELDEIDGEFDFCHVDGNHRRANCFHDLEICFAACKSGGTILIDDYSYIEGVKLGVHDFIDEVALSEDKEFGKITIIPEGIRGNVIFVK